MPDASIPRGWTEAGFGSLIRESQNGCSSRGGSGEQVVVLRLADVSVSTGEIAQKGLRKLALPDKTHSKYQLKNDDLLAIRVNGSKDIVGRLVQYKDTAESQLFCDHFIRLRVEDSVLLPTFTQRLFSSQNVRRQVDELIVSSAGQNTISQQSIKAITLGLPPLNEQRRIVAKIEALQARSDAAKQALDAVGPLLEQFRQSVLAAAFRGDLTAAWREQNPDVEPASALLERIRVERKARFIEAAGDKARAKAEAKARAAGKPWTEADAAKVVEKALAKAEAKYVEPEPVDAEGLPELPEGWCWAHVEELAWDGPTNGYSGKVSSSATGTLTMKLSATTQGHMVINSETTKRLQETVAPHSKHWLVAGDMLVQRANSLEYLGASAIFEGHEEPIIYPDLMMRLRLTEENTTQLAWRYLNSPRCRQWFRSKATGTAGNMPKINGGLIRKTPIPLPPEAELPELLKKVAASLSLAATAVKRQGSLHRNLDQLNQSILAKAFRGELVPQDPNDEPASVLLERIRAERAAAAPTKKPKKPRRKPKPKPKPTPNPAPTAERTPPPAPPSPPKQLDLLVHSPPERVALDDEPTEVMALLRTALRNRGAVERETVIHALAEGLGYQRVSAKLRKRLDGHLRAAVRRNILEAGGGEHLRLATRRVEDYERDELVASLRSVSRRRCVYPREELARALLDHLGFRRMTKGAKAAIKSAFNAAIRREVFERVDAEQVRRL